MNTFLNFSPTNFKLIKSLILLFLFYLVVDTLTAQVTLTEEEWVIPTYLVAPSEKNPIFFNNETHQGAAMHIYPYAMNDTYLHERVEKEYKSLTLENEYIKLSVIPELGGKLYSATDKTNGYDFIYKNDVVKPSNIGMTGAWISGGIEWCVLHHHRASTFLPINYDLVENEDGSKTIWIGESEPRQQMRWTIGITAFPGKSYFQAELKIHNNTPFTHSFLYWANLAAQANKDYQIIFPPSVQFATYHAKNDFTRWPISTEQYQGQDFTKGIDISYWKNSIVANSFFAHDLKEDFMGGYDHGRETGIVHVGDHNIVKGAKVWEWGSGQRGQTTEARLTENAGPYLELMTGIYSDNQPDYSWIKPYEVKTARQYWYPVKGIGGFKNANLNGAVNLEVRENNSVFIGYYSTQKVKDAKVTLKHNGKSIFEKKLEISPEKAFSSIVNIEENFELTDLYTEMINIETGEILVSYQPVEKEMDKELPEIVKPPLAPKDIKTVEEVFLAGKRIEQFHHATYNPMDYYEEALARDPGDIRTNTAIGNIYIRNGDFVNARKHLSKAIDRLTSDYTRPKECEPLYLQGLTLKKLDLLDEAIDTLYRASWDYSFAAASYLELSRISIMKGDLQKALEQINESLSTNAESNSAISLKTSILRRMGNFEGAAKQIKAITKTDPLDFRAKNEAYLIDKTSGNINKSDIALKTLNRNMRDFDQNYLELAVGYMNDGLNEEAKDILNRFDGKHPIVSYYLGYLEAKDGNKEQADKHFKEGSNQSEEYSFPFRIETIKVLEKALEYNPTDGMAYYYLGNIYYHRNQRDKAISQWKTAVEHNPNLAVAYRNIGWGYFNHLEDGNKAIVAYEKAIELKDDQPIYYEELDKLYEMSNTPIATRLKLFKGKNKVVSNREDALARQIAVLTLAGETEEAVDYLTDQQFSYREGSSRIRDIIIDAHLALGVKYLKDNNYQKALENFILAEVPDEEASGSSAGNRNIQVYYFIGLANEGLNNSEKSKENYSASAELESLPSGYISYYSGMSNIKLSKKSKANDIFNAMIVESNKQLKQKSESDFFTKFGESEAENARLSNAYLLKGLAYKGLGETSAATENLKKAVELSYSNLWAKIELGNLSK